MQTSLFKTPLELPNVATVPIYSPFRYPGGKSRWYPFVRDWLARVQKRVLVEPFAGGAHAGLAAAVEGMVDQVILVELDENVAAVWKTIMTEPEWLAEQIATLDLDRETAEAVIERKVLSTRDRALAMIVHNRVSRGGVTAPGAGWLKKGENGKGLQSRWYPDTLVKRIEKVAAARERITVICGDGLEVMQQHIDREDVALFIDPPYPKAGGRLYKHSAVDHERIFDLAVQAEGSVLLTYDDSEEVVELTEARPRLDSAPLLVSTTHHREKYEYLISDDLGWMLPRKQG